MGHRVLVLGGGKIGSLISCLLADTKDYQVHLADISPDTFENQVFGANIHTFILNVQENESLRTFSAEHKIQAIISALPYYCNPQVAETAKSLSIHYFDLTEDVEVTKKIYQLSQKASTAFVPQSGLAPGFISIAAQNLISHFDKVDTVKMRVGALPKQPSNALKYSLTWSTDGLINEYGNPCYGILHGKMTSLQPLEGYETIEVDGLLYEAFNTSGGLGTLADTWKDQVNMMNYKTLRYPGHCEKIQLLMNGLKLNQDRETLKRILENAIPKTQQDVVIIYVSVAGWKGNDLFEETYCKKIYPQEIQGKKWSAIQITTASSVCCVVDIVFNRLSDYQGFVTQESFLLEDFLNNRFGQYYQ